MVVEADGLLLDLDGVVWIDGRVPPGVAEMLQMLRSRGLPVLFFDQRPRASREQYVDRLNASGVPATAEQVLPALVLPRGWSPSGNPRAPRFWSGQPGAVRRGLGRRPATGRPRSRSGTASSSADRGARELRAAACPAGHLVASTVVLNPAGTRVLLVRSVTQGLRTEPGGHLEPEDPAVAGAALREAVEEDGILDLRLEPNLIDVEVFADDCALARHPPPRHAFSSHRT